MSPPVGIIMAGGSGERFWPVSRQKKPKQLLKLNHEKMTLLDEAVDRLLPIMSPDQIFISTNQILQEPIRAAMTLIPPENILAEPVRRNTMGCMAYVTAHMIARYGKDANDMVMAITTADHRIGDDNLFRNTINAAIWYAKEKNALIIVGLKPTRPETGYGYIQVDSDIHASAAFEGVSIFPTTKFQEKPTLEKAQEYIDSGQFFWNSGMFFWKISTFLDELSKHSPEFSGSITEMRNALVTGKNSDSKIASIFEKLPNISIDYALMEKSDNVYLAHGEFPWDDVGLWDALSRFRTKDSKGNVAIGDPILIDCQDVTVYNEAGAKKMAVGVVGLKNVVVATTPDGILVCSKDKAQDVREVVKVLKDRKASQI